ncbi:hypothetical protein G7046_g7389 [Stylonectria norvegica]|nr:hypothetical protein G7046_g7389 [Stylonectria norvegica]
MRFSLISAAFMGLAGAVLIPGPTGKYPVAMRVHPLTDKHRIDPYAPSNDLHKRRVLVSVFWPIDHSRSCSIDKEPYMPPRTSEAYGAVASSIGLANDTFSTLELEFCRVSTTKGCDANTKGSEYPLAVFSTGAGNSRLLYTGLARSLASQGYVVVTVDHPYDSDIVEFPDGSVILGANIPENTTVLEKATKVRADDLSFVVSQFENTSTRKSLVNGLPGKIDFSKIVLFGHSLGGAASAAAMLSDSRVRAGVDLDGRFFEPALSKGLDKPFMLLGRPKHRAEDATWAQFWKHLTGPKIELEVTGTVHGSFTDMPLLIKALDLPKKFSSVLAPYIGTVDGVEVQTLLAKVLSSFFTYTFDGTSKSLSKTLKNSPELSVVGSNLKGL